MSIAQHGAGSTGRGSSPRRVRSTTSWLGNSGMQGQDASTSPSQTARRFRTADALIVDVGRVNVQQDLRAPRAARAGVPCQKAPQFQAPHGLAADRSEQSHKRQFRDGSCRGGVLASGRRGVGQIKIPIQEHRALRSAVHGRPSISLDGVSRPAKPELGRVGVPAPHPTPRSDNPPPPASTTPLYAMYGRTREAESRVVPEKLRLLAPQRRDESTESSKGAPKARGGCGATHLRSIVGPRCQPKQGEMRTASCRFGNSARAERLGADWLSSALLAGIHRPPANTSCAA